jgi:tetratricopeptide (TPR) repeat protein/tRNA A-37 threonylcarbamoyl transferase component Bud32
MTLPCPPAAELERLLHGAFASADAAFLEAHLTQCADCRQLLDHLTSPPDVNSASVYSDVTPEYAAEWEQRQEFVQAALVGHLRQGLQEADDHHALLPDVPGYCIESRLGEGGAGVVYRARHEKLQRPVALKTLRPGTLERTEARARFQREAEVLSRLHHPHVVQLFDFGEVRPASGPAVPYMVLELVEGGTLGEKVHHRPVPARPAAALVELLARALQVVHEQGIIHRDLKPGNVLMQPVGTRAVRGECPELDRLLDEYVPKITDFGLAKQLTADQSPWTRTRDVLGTPAYMAPEQAGENTELTPAADIYALGVILYELLTGLPPFRAGDWVELLVQVKEQEPVPPSRLMPGVPRELETISLKCLSKDPRRRYASASALADDLLRFLNGQPILSRPAGAWEKLWKWCRRNPGVAGLSASLFLLLILGLTVTTWLSVVAEQRRAVAVDALDLLKQEQVHLQQEQGRTKDALKAEQRRREQARQALEAITSDIVPDWLGRNPELTAQQRQFLTRALSLYQEFARDTATDETSRVGVADAQLRVAQFQRTLGQRVEALRSATQAQQSWERLVKEFPKQREYGRNLALVYWLQSVLHRETGDITDAERCVRKGAALNRRLLAESGDDPKTQHQLCDCLNTLGTILRHTNRREEAEKQFRELKPLRQQLATRFPHSADYGIGLLWVHLNLALILKETSRLDGADKEIEAALVVAGPLAAEHADSARCPMWLARCHEVHADILVAQDKPAQAEPEYRASVKLLAGLYRDYPGQPDIQLSLVRTRASFSSLLVRTGKLPDAAVEARANLSLREQAAVKENASVEDRHGLAWAHCELARIEDALGETKHAEAEYRASLKVWNELASKPKSVALFPHERAETHTALGMLCTRTGRPADAEKEFRAALPLWKARAVEASSDALRQLQYGWCQNLLGAAVVDAGRPRDAEKELRVAVTILTPLAAAQPQVVPFRNELAGSMVNLARALASQNQWDEARQWLKKAEPHHEAALAAQPQNALHLLYYRNNRWVLSECLIQLGDHAAAAQTAEQWVRNAVDAKTDSYNCATCLAHCVALVRKDEKLTVERRRELEKQYGERALELLRQAVTAGFRDVEALKKNLVLEVIREQAGYQKLVAELEGGSRKQ